MQTELGLNECHHDKKVIFQNVTQLAERFTHAGRGHAKLFRCLSNAVCREQYVQYSKVFKANA